MDGFPVERLVLFGSKARGDADRESDLDLLVLTSEPLSSAEQARVRDELRAIEYRHDVWFGPVLISSRQWKEGIYQVLPLRFEIERDGVDL